MLYLRDCDRFLGIVNLKEIWCNCALGFTLHLPCGHAQPPHLFCGLCGPVQETRLPILDLERLPPYPPLAMVSHLPCSTFWYAAGGCSKPARSVSGLMVVGNNRPLGSHHADAWATFWALCLFRSNIYKDLMTVNIGSGVIVYIFMFLSPVDRLSYILLFW